MSISSTTTIGITAGTDVALGERVEASGTRSHLDEL